MIFPEEYDRLRDDFLTERREIDLPTAIRDAQYRRLINLYAHARLEGTFSQILKQLKGGENE